MCRLARHTVPLPLRFDDQQQLRVITYSARCPAVADAAFNQIRQYGSGSAAVLICLIETLIIIASQCRRQEDLDAIAHHANLVARAARRSLPEEADFEDRYAALPKAVRRVPPSPNAR